MAQGACKKHDRGKRIEMYKMLCGEREYKKNALSAAGIHTFCGNNKLQTTVRHTHILISERLKVW